MLEDTLLTPEEIREEYQEWVKSCIGHTRLTTPNSTWDKWKLEVQDLKTKRKMVEWLDRTLHQDSANRGLPNTPRYDWTLLDTDLQALKKKIEEGK